MRKHFTKLLLLLTILMTCKFSLKSQDFLPFVNDNYAGISSVHFQPASIADSRLKFDLTLAGLSLNLHNNYLYLNKDYVPELLRNPDMDLSKLYGFREYNGLDKYIYQDVRLDLMNFMITINPRFAIGFTAGIREVINVDNIPEPFIELMQAGSNDGIIPTEVMLNEKDMRINMNSWVEYGISLAGVLYKSDHHVVKGGMNIKLLEGLASAYLNINDVNYQLFGDDSVGVYNTKINYGISNGVGELIEGYEFDVNNIVRRRGVGLDFGIVWEWRPDYESHLYDMDGKTNLERRNENKYKLKVGLSVRDLGSVKFKKWQYSQDFIVNGFVNGHMFDDIESMEDISHFINNSEFIQAIEGNDIYRMALPTTISMQVDYNIYKNLYINFTPNIALRQGSDQYAKIHSYSNVSLTPRYETAMFGFSLPIQYSTFNGFAAGAGLRLGPLWVGSNNILSTFLKPDVDKLNVQMLVKIPIPYLKVKDRDGDKVSNRKDKCKKVYGVWENCGCPEEDNDKDGVPNDIDKCPDIFGKAEFNGCPDTDNDGIADLDDECPDMPGLALYNGCPDSDGDSIPDPQDQCPTIFGLAIFNGCPDTDNDSIPDYLDKCPTMAGLAIFEGCPDTDGDGIPDHLDKCPTMTGLEIFEGCPDTDGDGIQDSEDQCPNLAGLVEFNGCPDFDSDGDGLKDSEDQCPNIAGPIEFNGCPDSDGDGIQDSEDQCPNLAGPVEFDGCPDSDGDSIPDHLDKCPSMTGLVALGGCPDTDSDGDGINDSEDQCPNVAGPIEFNGCPDSDGDGVQDSEDKCPNLAGPIEFNGCPDSDGDGVQDSEDKCPNIAGPVEFNGCPDSDGDNIPDHLDDCPMIKGLVEFNGCPDTDGDGVMDKDDKCPEEPGAIENEGCPIYIPVEFATNIGFESGKATLTKESYPYLDQLVDLMNEDERCWVKLDGHTDNTGSDKINQKLSQSRVDTIKDYLIEKGINPNRIIAKGHGSSKPIADNKTAKGRAQNRRVEINIAH